ncbi:MAG: sulfatase [Akkermansiaceae bacterium]
MKNYIALFILMALASSSYGYQKPNIIVIIIDDMGWADIGYHNPKVYSPNIDKLAGGAAQFTQHYVMPQCTPTRVALMTGKYPGRFGGAALSASNSPSFPLGTPTLAAMLKKAGYATFMAGKWHLGSSPAHGPNHFGFDSSYGSLAGAVGNYDHRYRKGKFEHTWHRDGKLIEGSENGTHTTELVKREAIRVISEKRDQPYFLYLPFHAVHTPLDERGKFVDRPTQVDPKKPGRWLNEKEIRWFNDPDGKIQSQPDHEKRLLLAAVHHLDHAIGEIVSAVDKSGQRENTLILFSSDNGPQGSWAGNAYPDDLRLTDFNQPMPWKGKKLAVWEGGTRVPGFAFWPGKITPKKVNDAVHIIDWFPTLAKLVGSKFEGDGIDLSPVVIGEGSLPDRELYWTWGARVDRWALLHGEWKIVHYGKNEPKKPSDWELYNLKNDPKENENLATRHSDKLDEMHQRFLKQRAKDAKPKK